MVRSLALDRDHPTRDRARSLTCSSSALARERPMSSTIIRNCCSRSFAPTLVRCARSFAVFLAVFFAARFVAFLASPLPFLAARTLSADLILWTVLRLSSMPASFAFATTSGPLRPECWRMKSDFVGAPLDLLAFFLRGMGGEYHVHLVVPRWSGAVSNGAPTDPVTMTTASPQVDHHPWSDDPRPVRIKKPRVVSPDEVHVRRDGEHAIIDYADPSYGGMDLKVGPNIEKMTDEEIVELHNHVVRCMQEARRSYDHVAVEVPVGKPQMKYDAACDQWVPRGDVLRCVITDTADDESRARVIVDDRELDMREFGRLLSTYSGWGMRIVFVPDDEIDEDPAVEVREPEGEE